MFLRAGDREIELENKIFSNEYLKLLDLIFFSCNNEDLTLKFKMDDEKKANIFYHLLYFIEDIKKDFIIKLIKLNPNLNDFDNFITGNEKIRLDVNNLIKSMNDKKYNSIQIINEYKEIDNENNKKTDENEISSICDIYEKNDDDKLIEFLMDKATEEQKKTIKTTKKPIKTPIKKPIKTPIKTTKNNKKIEILEG